MMTFVQRRRRVVWLALTAILAVLAVALTPIQQARAAGESTIFGATAPTTQPAADPNAVELGVKFRTDVSGYIAGVRFYKSAANTGTHVGNLWDTSGNRLATVTFTGETATGWQEARFAAPVAVTAGTTYVASYYTPTGYYYGDNGAFATAGAGASPVRALADGVDGGNGVYRYGAPGGFPNSTWKSSNYWVDVLFTTAVVDTVAATVTATTPTAAATGVSPATAVSATFSETIDPATASLTLTGPSGAVALGAATWDGTTRTLQRAPTAALATNTTFTATVSGAKDVAGNVMTPVSWTFTTAAAVTGCPCSVYPAGTVPATPSVADGGAVELGMRFTSATDGYVTGVRFYKGTGNGGVHLGNLWTATGTLMATAQFSGESASGWQQVSFGAPIAIKAGTAYVVSYFAPLGNYAATSNAFTTALTNGPLTAPASTGTAGNGLYAYGGTQFPANTYKASSYFVDVVFDTKATDAVAPTIVGRAPVPGATGVPIGTAVSATFSEPVNAPALTVVKDADGTAVAGTTAYDATSRTVTFTPSSPLGRTTVYRATVPAASDLAGNVMAAPVSWTFTTEALSAVIDPNTGPGGPVMVVTTPTNPYSTYLAEILRAEGLNAFTVAPLSGVTPTALKAQSAVVLGQTTLTATQAQMFRDYVTGGGNLVAVRPDKQLADLFGLTTTTATQTNGYLKVVTTTGPGVGITDQTIQFKGAADKYTLNGATSVATMYSSATTATTNPAVTLRSVGTAGGQAAMFAYDLGRSVIQQRQGNPAWAGTERDGQAPKRSDDLYFGGSVADWVDLSKVAIPQADEQQRLLANLLTTTTRDAMPLPRFFYFPRMTKAVVVATGDDHGNNGTQGRFDTFLANSPAGCSVASWTCPRYTSYIYPATPLPVDKAVTYQSQGFEVGAHVSTNCADWTATSLPTFYTNDLGSFATRFPGISRPRTSRTHCIVWSDWATQPKVEKSNNIRLDTNYYYWPATWVNDRPGFMTGSGMPMRFADTNGAMIDVFQAATQMTDESGQTYPFTPNTLLDRALGPLGYYGAFTANLHTDLATMPQSDATLASAQARGVPVITSAQLLTWLDGRSASTFTGLAWANGVLTFGVSIGAGADGLSAMLPTTGPNGTLTGLTVDGVAVPYQVQTVKGVEYAVFQAQAGAYRATYGTATVASVAAASTLAVAPASGPAITSPTVQTSPDGSATLGWTTPVGATTKVVYGTSATSLGSTVLDANPARAHQAKVKGLAAGTTYHYRVTSTDAFGRTSTWPAATAAPATFRTGAVDRTAPVVSRVDATPVPGTGAVLDVKASEPVTVTVQYGPDADRLSVTTATDVAARNAEVVLSGLEPDRTYHYRVVATDAAGNATQFPAAGRPPLRVVGPSLGVGATSVVSLRTGGVDGVAATRDGDGELRLAGESADDFDAARGTSGSTARTDRGGSASLRRGDLVLDGTRWRTKVDVAAGRTAEATVTFAGQGRQFVGLSVGGADQQHAGLVNAQGTIATSVRTAAGTTTVTPVPGLALGAPIAVTVQRVGDTAELWADGTRVATVPLPASGKVALVAEDRGVGNGDLLVASARVSGSRTSGTYTSAVLDAGQRVTWDRATWLASTPSGAAVEVQVRTGSRAVPDASWSAWTTLSGSGAVLASAVPDSRYLQYRVVLRAADPGRAPVLRSIGFSHNGVAPATHDIA